jgi:predicted O-methyltransferase YrrM
MPVKTLDEIGLAHGTDKSSACHGFLRVYETALLPLAATICNVLEIGVYDGSSLRMWSEYFPNAKITGLDVDPRCLDHSRGAIRVRLCDQSDVSQLLRVATDLGPFDLVVDDGSHIWSHQILTLETLLPFVSPGGIYILEDIDTSFGHHRETYGKDSTESTAGYVQRLIGYVMAWTATDLKFEPNLRMRTLVEMIDTVTVLRRSVMFKTKIR